jgi:hypothetical protein
MRKEGGTVWRPVLLAPRNPETCFSPTGQTSLTGARIRSPIDRADHFVDSK